MPAAHAAAVAAAPAVVSGPWSAAPSGYGVRIAPISLKRQGTSVESVEIKGAEQQSTTSNKGKTSANGAGMTTSLRRDGGVPPRGRPV
jgi:hypothetical protein